MTTNFCISVQIGPGSKLMGYYYMTDDVESFSLPWADLPWLCQQAPPLTTTPHPLLSNPAVTIAIRSQIGLDPVLPDTLSGVIWSPWSSLHHRITASNLIIFKQDCYGSINCHVTDHDSKSHWWNSALCLMDIELNWSCVVISQLLWRFWNIF